MKLRSYFFILLAVGILFFGASKQYQSDYDPVKESYILKAVLSVLEAAHFDPEDINDDFSLKVYKEYLDNMDSGRRFLVQSDIEQLNAYKLNLDDQVKSGDLAFFDLSYNLLNNGINRAKEFYDYWKDYDFDFNKDESIEFDPDKKPFAQDEAQLSEYWRKYIKYELLSRHSSKIEANKKKPETEWKTEEELLEDARKDLKNMLDRYFNNITKISRLKRFEVFVNSFTFLFDPHTTYFTPKDKQDFKLRMSGALEGIGARLTPDGDYTKVSEVVVGGPAWKQKDLEVDDLIISVAQDGEEPISAVGMHIDDVVSMIRGKKGTKVTLSVKKVDGTEQDITIEREKVILDDDASAQSLLLNLDGELDNFGYINLPSFYSDIEDEDRKSCAKDVAKELEKLQAQNVKGVILDLRNNGGGYFHEVIDMTGLFIKEGPIVQAKGRRGNALKYYDEDPEIHYDGPLVVLVNEYSASASEILAAALQDYDRAVIVGSDATFGKGTVQRFYDLDRIVRVEEDLKPLGEIKLTTQTYYRVDGGSTQLHGVKPDIVLPNSYRYLEIGEREYDSSIPYSEIDALKHDQDGYFAPDVDKINLQSKHRVEANESFQLVEANAQRLKAQRDLSTYSLNRKQYEMDKQKRAEEAKKYKNISSEIEHLNVVNLPQDMMSIQSDSVKIEKNDAFVKAIHKDIYVEECIQILKDVIKGERIAKNDLKKNEFKNEE